MKLIDQDELPFTEVSPRRNARRESFMARPAPKPPIERMPIAQPRWAGVEAEPAPAMPPQSEAIPPPELKEPFYKRFLENRFFAPAKPADPMKNNGRLY